MKRIIAAAALLFSGDALAYEKMPPELDALVMRGITSIHQLDFDGAEKDFSEILEKYPGQPYGYFGLAMSQWGRLEYQQEESNPALDELYEKKTDEAIDKGEAWLKKHPEDASAHVCVGGMYGLRSRLALMKHSWIRAYFTGRKGLKHMKTAIKLDSEYYDAYLGPGMYEYYAGTLPAVIRILAKFLVSGDPKKGLEYLNLVREKGHYTATAAKLLLIEIYTQTGSKYANPALALEWAKELRKQSPNHPMLHFVEIVCLYENGKWEEVRAEAEEYLRRIEKGEANYSAMYTPRALIALGTSYLAENKLDKALEAFVRAEPPSKEKPNRWAVWSVVRAGNIHDLQGERKKAVADYKRALGYQDHWGFRDYITAYLRKPYAAEQNPGQLPPP
ncbi:MAG: hypothetical protein WC421_07120 [Elusimicrobiales bacterium]